MDIYKHIAAVSSDKPNPFAGQEITDVKAAVKARILANTTMLVLYALVISAALVLTVWTGAEDFVIFAIMIAIVYYAYQYRQARAAFIEQFAKANGYEYLKTGDVSLLEGAAFTLGHSRTMENVVRGAFSGRTFHLFTYSYTVGSGKSKRTYVSTVFELDFDKPIPHLVLVSKSANQRFPLKTDGLRMIQLEGYFDKYFTLYVPEKLEIEALEIFTPDVMHDMITNAWEYSVEFVDDKIYIYFGSDVTKLATLHAMYRLAETMHARMTEFLSKKRDQWFFTQDQIKQQ